MNLFSRQAIRIGRAAAIAGFSLVAMLVWLVPAHADSSLTFAASASSIVSGGQLDVHSVSACAAGSDNVRFLLLFSGAAFTPPTLPVNPDGSWSGTLTLSTAPHDPGDYQLEATCFGGGGLTTTYTTLPLTVSTVFAANATTIVSGGQLDVHSVSACAAGSDNVRFLLLFSGAAFTPPTLPVNPDGSWSGTLTLSTAPHDPGDYQLEATCFGSGGLTTTYTTLPLTVTSPDSTPPLVTISLSSPHRGVPDGQGGWFVSGPMAGTVSADDTATGGSNISSIDCGSLVLTMSGLGTPSASGTFSIAAEGVMHISCTATDSAANTSAPVTQDVMLDTQAPSVSLNPAVDSCSLPGSNGWCRGTQTAGFSASDAASGVASPCTGSSCNFTKSTTTEGPAVLVNSGTVCDVAGNCAAGIDAGPYKIDATAPTVSRNAEADSCSQPGRNGWCRGTQTAGFTANDGTSGVASPCTGSSCDFAKSSSTEGSAVTIAASQVCDVAGNCTGGITVGPFKLDHTAPSLAPTISPSPVLLHGTATASPNGTDGVSGVAAQSCGAVDTSSAIMHTLTCTATDNAGNTASVTVSYLVGYKILGLFSPVPNSKWKQGQTVPVKFALADANGVRIADSEAQGLLSPTCRVTFSATGAQSVSGCVKYDTANHQFIYNWKLGQKTGNVTISVTVSYPGTTGTTVLSEPIVVTT
jgi:hypothetical protein